jgi:hypothetical protein
MSRRPSQASHPGTAAVPEARWHAQRRWPSEEGFPRERTPQETRVAGSSLPGACDSTGRKRSGRPAQAPRLPRDQDSAVVDISYGLPDLPAKPRARPCPPDRRSQRRAGPRARHAGLRDRRGTPAECCRVEEDRTPKVRARVLGPVPCADPSHSDPGEARAQLRLEQLATSLRTSRNGIHVREVDYFSSGPTFTGWKEPMPAPPMTTYQALPMRPPSTWLLSVGWTKAGQISMFATPGQVAQ